jgi:DNA-binding beta-propeller fold protein YncE
VGIGQAFGELFGIAVDTLNDRILVTDNAMDAVIAVDPVSGDRSVLSDNSGSHGEGPLFVSPLGIAVYGDRALVVDVLNDALVAVDLVTGDREIISQNGGAGSGASFDAPMDLVMGGAGQAYVISQFTDTLFSVNVDTGARAIITMGVGANDFDEPSYMAVDLARNRAIISLNQPPGGTSGLMLVDLISGNREFKMFFSGVGAAGISGLLMDPATMRLYTTNYALHSIGIYDIDANSQILISR